MHAYGDVSSISDDFIQEIFLSVLCFSYIEDEISISINPFLLKRDGEGISDLIDNCFFLKKDKII